MVRLPWLPHFLFIYFFYFSDVKLLCIILYQPKKRRLNPDSGLSEGKRRRKDEEDSERTKEEEEDEEERIAEEKLKQLQELAEKSVTEKSGGSQPSTSSSPSKACTKSSWQQISTLMIYTAAGVKASDKVRPSHRSWLFYCGDFNSRSSLHLYCIIYIYAFLCIVLLWLCTGN